MTKTLKRPEARRHEIVKMARHLFQTRSYEQTTIQDVLEQLGIAKGTLYHYFASKEDLLEAVIEDIVEDGVARMQSLVDETPGDARDKIRALLSMRPSSENTSEIIEQLRHPGNVGMYARILVVTLQKQAPVFTRLIQQGCEEGLFHTDAPLEATELGLTAMLFLTTDQGIYPWPHDVLRRRAAAFPALFERMLQAPAGSLAFLFAPAREKGDDT